MRVRGYVVGCDRVGGEFLWTVKVKDVGSTYNGKKLPVMSLHPGTMLTKPAVDVTFNIVNSCDVPGDIKAGDVSLGTVFPEDHLTVETSVKSMSFAFVEENGKISTWYNECETEEECREWLRGQSDECHLMAFLRISASDFGEKGKYGDYVGARAFFEGLRMMMTEVDSASHIVSTIVSASFELGLNSAPGGFGRLISRLTK